jgi:protein-tyrosine-phosphatase
MAAALLRRHGGNDVLVRSAGTEPADRLNPAVVDVMAEVGIDLAAESPKLLTPDSVEAADVVITMGCGDTCPFFPGTRYLDWPLDDPAGRPVDEVRVTRDEIDRRVRRLVAELRTAS